MVFKFAVFCPPPRLFCVFIPEQKTGFSFDIKKEIFALDIKKLFLVNRKNQKIKPVFRLTEKAVFLFDTFYIKEKKKKQIKKMSFLFFWKGENAYYIARRFLERQKKEKEKRKKDLRHFVFGLWLPC